MTNEEEKKIDKNEAVAAEAKEQKPKRPRSLPTDALIILPLRSTVLFPSTIAPLTAARPASVKGVEEAVRQEMPIGIVAQRDPKVEVPQPKDLYEVGTAGDILRLVSVADGQRQILVQGRQRFKILDFIQTEPYLVARVSYFSDVVPKSNDFEARIRHMRQEANRAWSLLP
ncbi:MAG: LON peptidase substrate-binding domain-containing protein, partial [Candidatus Binatia bacterium]